MVSLTPRKVSLVLVLVALSATVAVAAPVAATHCYHDMGKAMDHCRGKADGASSAVLFASASDRHGAATTTTWTASDLQTTVRCTQENGAFVWADCADRFFLEKLGYNADRVNKNLYLVFSDMRAWAAPSDPGAPPAWLPSIGAFVACAYPSFSTSCTTLLG